MTRDEALAKFLEGNPGLTADDATPEDLATYGFEPAVIQVDPQAPAVSDDQVNTATANLASEAQSNTTGAQIIDGVKQVAGVVGTLAGVAVKAP